MYNFTTTRLGLWLGFVKVRVWGLLESYAFGYNVQSRVDVVDPPEALEFDLFDVRGTSC
jgi:hypothetical protein